MVRVRGRGRGRAGGRTRGKGEGRRSGGAGALCSSRAFPSSIAIKREWRRIAATLSSPITDGGGDE